MKTIQAQWQEFATACYPSGMVPDQERQLHRAFFSGALVAIQSVMRSADTAATEEQGIRRLDALLNECLEFGKHQQFGIQRRN